MGGLNEKEIDGKATNLPDWVSRLGGVLLRLKSVLEIMDKNDKKKIMEVLKSFIIEVIIGEHKENEPIEFDLDSKSLIKYFGDDLIQRIGENNLIEAIKNTKMKPLKIMVVTSKIDDGKKVFNGFTTKLNCDFKVGKYNKELRIYLREKEDRQTVENKQEKIYLKLLNEKIVNLKYNNDYHFEINEHDCKEEGIDLKSLISWIKNYGYICFKDGQKVMYDSKTQDFVVKK